MEEKTLQELNEEYVSLRRETEQLKLDLETAKKAKEVAVNFLETAETSYEDAKKTYEAKKAALDASRAANVSKDILKSFETEVDMAKNNMDITEALLKRRQEEVKNSENAFSIIEENAKNSNNRMNLILVSFASNETIYNTLVNEVEVDFEDKISEKENEKSKIDELKTKINDDERIQENVADLRKLLQDFEAKKAVVKPENAQELTKMAEEIKKKRETIRRRLGSKTIGIKGGKISAAEIDRMALEQDDEGRMVVPELDRRESGLDTEIGSLLYEKDQTIKSMNIMKEMAKNLDVGTPEYQKLLAEIQQIEGEIRSAEEIKQKATENLAKIPEERANLEKELKDLENNIDTEAISRLEAEKKAIEAEPVSKITNPRLAEIDKEIKDLEDKKASGGKGDVETEDYKKAKKEFEEAERLLKGEQKIPSLRNPMLPVMTNNYLDGDEIIPNPKYVEIEDKIRKKTNRNKEIYNLIYNPSTKKCIDTDLEDLDVEIDEQEKVKNDLITEIEKIDEDLDVYESKALETYVGKRTYPELENPDSNSAKAFKEYRDAELKLRKAMISLQKDPSKDNKALLQNAIVTYKNMMDLFQEALAEDKGILGSGVVATPEAMHKYLMGVIRSELDSGIEIDDAYDSNNVTNRFKILEYQNKKDEDFLKDLEGLKATNDTLTKYLNDILVGKERTDADLEADINRHNEAINNFEHPDEVIEVLTGTGMPQEKGKVPFWRKIFKAKLPELEKDYNLPKNKLTTDVKNYLNKKNEREEKEEELDSITQKLADLNDKFDQKTKEILGEDKYNEYFDNKSEIENLEKQKKDIAPEINKTALERLEQRLQMAKQKLDSTPQYEATVDVDKIDEQISSLKHEKASTAQEIDDPAKVADKQRRANEKQDEIDKLSKGTNGARISEIKTRLTELLGIESTENRNLEEANEKINNKSAELRDKKQRFKILDKVKSKMISIKNLINIKDEKRISRNGSEAVAEDLSKDAKQNLYLDDEEIDR